VISLHSHSCARFDPAAHLPPSSNGHGCRVLAPHSRAFTTARPVSTAVRCRLHVDGRRSGVDASRPRRDGWRTDGHYGRWSVLVLRFRSDRLANVLGILFYVPILLCLPVLLVGAVLVCIPGGFIIVLGGLYYAFVGFTGLLGLAVSRRRWSGASRVPPNPSSESASRSGRSSSGSRRAIAARPPAFGLATDPAVGSAPNFELSRGVSDNINLVAARERGQRPDRQDGPPAA
jgi:hypothetical protein